MIEMKELLKKAKLEDQTPEIQANLKILLERLNKVRVAWGKPMTSTSGLRTMADHLRIYKEKGITDQTLIPMKSKHLSGEADDISDPQQELQAWCKENVEKLEEIGLWMEDFSATPTWVHFQIVPPRSGKRWFVP